jgi:hypothetical protein
VAVEHDRARASAVVGVHCFAEERLRACDAAVTSQQEIDGAPLLVDRAIQVTPSVANLE